MQNFIIRADLFYNEYFFLILYILLAIIISFLLLFLSFGFSSYNPEVNKLTIYECGFDPYDDARNDFDVRFYIVAILFLVFDLETVFFLPWCVSISFLSSESYWGMIDFIFELFLGLVYAWVVGALDW